MTLELILSHPEDTRLSELVHPFDRYSIEMELSDAGRPICWDALMECRTVGDLAGLVGEVA